MMKMKKFSAALLAVVMLISMLSCMVFNASALEVPKDGELPSGWLIVNDDWAGMTGKVSATYYIDGVEYHCKATMGGNAFDSINDAVAAARAGGTVYVCEGAYDEIVTIKVGYLTILGAKNGVTPNNPDAEKAQDLQSANPARPSADLAPEAALDETVFYGYFSLYGASAGLEVDGMYLTSGSLDPNTTTHNQNFSLDEGGKWKVGPEIRNCIVNSTASYVVSSLRGRNPEFVFEDNRVQNSKIILGTGGMMGITIRNNYIYGTGVSAYFDSIEYGSIGQACLIENNYYALCSGMANSDRGAAGYVTASYSIQLKDNYVEQMGNTYLLQMAFYARHTMPDTNAIVTGNTINGIQAGAALFRFNYYELSDMQLVMSRYRININNNSFDLPAGTKFITSGMNGFLDCTYNYFANGISGDQITKYKDAQLSLYPYYVDAEMTTLAGDARITGLALEDVAYEIDNTKMKVHVDLDDLNVDVLDLNAVLQVSAGCTWKLYTDKFCSEEIKNKKLYFDGQTTNRYVEVTNPDGASAVYALTVTRDISSDAELLDVELSNSSLVTGPAVVENTSEGDKLIRATYTYELDSDLAFLDYDLKVSSGAKVELYDNAFFSGDQIEDLGGYIPYIGYKNAGEPYAVYAKITSEDGSRTLYYKLVFKRAKSKVYDPGIVDAEADDAGAFMIRQDYQVVYYYPTTLLKAVTIDLQATPGANYEIYADAKLTKKLSPDAALEPVALTLNPGVNTFYVKVAENGGSSNTYELVVYNEEVSSNANITGLSGAAAPVVGNTITLATAGSTFNASFVTANKYATCKVYADAAKKYEVAYTSTITDEYGTNRKIESRSFTLPLEGQSNTYYVVCTAEDGVTKKDYTLTINKSIAVNIEYKDVPTTGSAWYTSYVYEATALGYITGSQHPTTGEYNYKPGDNTTREQMAVILTKIAGLASANFANVKLPYADQASISEWALPYMKATYATGLMSGAKVGNKLYSNAKKNITRGEVMVLIAALIDCPQSADLGQFKDGATVPSWGAAAAEEVVAAGIIAGANGKLNFNKTITRAEIATIAAATARYLGK